MPQPALRQALITFAATTTEGMTTMGWLDEAHEPGRIVIWADEQRTAGLSIPKEAATCITYCDRNPE
ncbi:hypothetical protein [Pseudanabaena sp. FACHB-2040]|uniref:hypothetical protein n=1 Tax=Pseudanabaena sp. FACHB-2040 TaxID=2692859 RepID=UPI00168A35D2|nr:hypothetical protein [Pseudanabaena sp. FACHB-2040]MBD2261364.1 hypothetical protein [Pseudanabaena sp. FACHB-2040]